jgi:hypothetical protein
MSHWFGLLRLLGGTFLLSMIITCAKPPTEGTEPGDCVDGADNDGDGLYDCDDSDCADGPYCLDIEGDDDDSSAGACGHDEMLDCNINCAPTEWLGDGQCDDGAYPYYGNLIDFACLEHQFDNGDCEPTGDDDDDDDDDDTTGDDDDSAVEPFSFGDIYTLVTVNCSCHSNSDHKSGFAFASSPSSLYESWVGNQGSGVPAIQASSIDRIEPGNASQSYVIHKIEGTHLSVGGSGSRMPQGGPFLSDEDVSRIREWIDAGALNN